MNNSLALATRRVQWNPDRETAKATWQRLSAIQRLSDIDEDKAHDLWIDCMYYKSWYGFVTTVADRPFRTLDYTLVMPTVTPNFLVQVYRQIQSIRRTMPYSHTINKITGNK